MGWEVSLVLHLTITAPAIGLFLTYLAYEIEERWFRG